MANENGVINLVDAVTDGTQDNTFFIVSGLATSSGYSFRSTRKNNEYINHSNARLRMDADGRAGGVDLFQNDATWTLHIGEFPFFTIFLKLNWVYDAPDEFGSSFTTVSTVCNKRKCDILNVPYLGRNILK